MLLPVQQVAADLINHPQAGEAHYRAAVSRQYYALFILARDKLGIDQREEVHQAVAEALTERNQKAGMYLSQLRQLRNRADYVFPSGDTWKRAATVHQSLAESMAKTIEALK